MIKILHWDFFSKLQEEIKVDNRRLSQAAICKFANLKTSTFAGVKSGENPKLYPYYAVLRVYLRELLKMDRDRLLQLGNELLAALEDDYITRRRLLE